MTDMERRRLQLYAKSAKLQHLRRTIEVLEEILGPLYREVEEWERTFVTVKPRVAKQRPRRR